MTARPSPRERVLEKLRALCLSLPEAHETLTWGHPNFRAGKKIFCAFHDDRAGSPCIWVRTDPVTLELVRDDERFSPSAHGGLFWVGLRADQPLVWSMVRELLVASYRLVALKGLVKKLEEHETKPPAPRRRARHA